MKLLCNADYQSLQRQQMMVYQFKTRHVPLNAQFDQIQCILYQHATNKEFELDL